MRHIKKTPETSEVKEYEDELKKGKFDKEHLSDPLVHPSMEGPDVYDAVKSFTSFERLKDRMFSDQGGDLLLLRLSFAISYSSAIYC